VKHLHFDCFSGISGDMTLGALLDLDTNEERAGRHNGTALETILREGLALLPLPKSFELKTWREPRQSIMGTRVAVLVGGHDADEVATGLHATHEPHSHPHGGEAHSHDHHAHHHDHGHDHQQSAHTHEHTHQHAHHEHSHHHDHHAFKHIKAQILSSKLAEEVKHQALQIFQRLALAEGKLHGQDPEEVEFHEVGAVDSIVDIVGVSILLRYLNPFSVSSSPLPMGHGFIKCRHGRMPVPAPATLELLRGIPVYDANMRGELVTPTGAAIIAAVATSFSRFVSFTPQQIGYGMGKNDFADRPNALRVVLGEMS
jgi:pyridinium-3,5-bisthiocarboxylic acid mononucleotide nickel chelatase